MDDSLRKRLAPGAKVKVTQQIAARDYTWTTAHTGTVVYCEQKTTGSWFAHSKNDKLWLDRLKLRKADGEILTLNLDDYSVVEIETDAPGTGAPGTGAPGTGPAASAGEAATA